MQDRDRLDSEEAERRRMAEDAPRRGRNIVRMMRAELVRYAPEDEEAIQALIWIRDVALPELIQEAAADMLAGDWSQSDMSRLLGVSRQAIHSRFATARQIAAAGD